MTSVVCDTFITCRRSIQRQDSREPYMPPLPTHVCILIHKGIEESFIWPYHTQASNTETESRELYTLKATRTNSTRRQISEPYMPPLPHAGMHTNTGTDSRESCTAQSQARIQYKDKRTVVLFVTAITHTHSIQRRTADSYMLPLLQVCIQYRDGQQRVLHVAHITRMHSIDTETDSREPTCRRQRYPSRFGNH